MRVEPSLEDVEARYRAGHPTVVWTRLVADLETPVSAMLKLCDGKPNSFLLESVEGGAVRGRYSLIGLQPDLIWRCHGDKAEINRKARFDANRFEPVTGGAIASLRALIEESKIELPEGLPPMAAGLFGYLGYDMVRLMEKLPDIQPDRLGLPDGVFLRPTIMAVFDNVEDIVTVVTPVRPQTGLDARAAYNLACERLAAAVEHFDRNLPQQREAAGGPAELPEPSSNMASSKFHAMVQKAKEYILAGDIFQVVLSQRFSLPFKLSPFALYRSLRRLNPSPFLFFLDFGGFSVVGSSPEILVRLRDKKVTIRPIAGTRRRGASAVEDKALAEDLLGDPKERAEHLMLLDLGRNDVGRVAKIGSVKVTEKYTIEYYSHVMHIVSNVEGEIDPQHDAMDALIAGFPAGTVSGAPKVRAMEIIEELEPERRGLYGGAVGYFAADGAMDTCIALRTAVVKDGVMYVQAGGGIVYDSSPDGEFQESVNKAKALVRAAQEAVRFASGGRNR
ncbi:anthranilate synthase component I [Hypericibacter terrae]|uniref:Anthranilate synthase component 1 n=1 Tax=Hypericibacter terrae TaxID=2602015 RepID=A0A5J6MLT2_9PROT|nr:anthranilate synthase component I [Hypericibacter terrae]QEX17190.1 anthranilate synthase component I [Hypericibacter terrae]